MTSDSLTPIERVLQLPVETRVVLLDFLKRNTRDLGGAADAEEKHIARIASLRTVGPARRTC